MLVGGIIPMQFSFGAGAYYGMKFEIAAKVLEMKAICGVEPYGGVMVYGELGIGFLLYGKLRLEGKIMDLRFPTTAEISFNKFPLDVGKDEEDKTPPDISPFSDEPNIRRKKRATASCDVEQIAGRDYVEPMFEIAVRAEDDRSDVAYFLDVGTVQGGKDVMDQHTLGGPKTSIDECSMESLDRTSHNFFHIPIRTCVNTISESSYTTTDALHHWLDTVDKKSSVNRPPGRVTSYVFKEHVAMERAPASFCAYIVKYRGTPVVLSLC
ncbi:Hypothetical predicted protein [Mytilus galloprovincialis]|uniref:Uncharacterized protein n=1 Tax=Mytilus galloprovincialis TaxID=29158 RepID=A0A8B6E879_MYTGA|nr:Hypothetical predicted protein [Mytilus galloprovincialis]